MDLYMLSMLFLYFLLTLLFWNSITPSDRNLVVGECLSFLVMIVLIVFYVPMDRSRWLAALRKFYSIPLIYPIYSLTHVLLPHLRTTLYDQQLVNIDYRIFGVNPTDWIYQFSHPYLTEYLQWCYVAFFFLPCIHGFELFLRNQQPEVLKLSRMMIFSLFVSYLAYFAYPAIGPRFTLHNYTNLNSELPGVFLTKFFRDKVSEGAGITNIS